MSIVAGRSAALEATILDQVVCVPLNENGSRIVRSCRGVLVIRDQAVLHGEISAPAGIVHDAAIGRVGHVYAIDGDIIPARLD